MSTTDERWMQYALNLAEKAALENEVPVGAVLVLPKEGMIAEAWNCPIKLNDPTAHAEILALRQAGHTLKNYRLTEAALYVTLEPCVMCAGAILNARIKRLVFGAFDPKAGAAGTACDTFHGKHVHHQVEIFGGVLSEACQKRLTDFFKDKRK